VHALSGTKSFQRNVVLPLSESDYRPSLHTVRFAIAFRFLRSAGRSAGDTALESFHRTRPPRIEILTRLSPQTDEGVVREVAPIAGFMTSFGRTKLR